MVVRIRTGKSIRRALSYNERKLVADKADLLLAGNFPIDEELMGFSTKFRMFQSLIDRNPKIETNAVHVSLNFPPEENLSDERLTAIAMEYMERIGFATQPFLVYRHRDANHPHIHIVTTNLRRFGRPLNLHNLAKDKSEAARKQLESIFGLIPAESRPRRYGQAADIAPWPVHYGKEETKHAITNILGNVLSTYKFENLDQLNAVLAQFRITAYRGSQHSRMYKTSGLVYQILDAAGNRVGIPIKASSIHQSPTLKNLERSFARGQIGKIADRSATKKEVDWCMAKREGTISLKELLEKRHIGLVIEKDPAGAVKTAFFIDHRRRAVFTTNDLGVNAANLVKSMAAPPSPDTPKDKPSAAISKDDNGPLQQFAIPASTLSFFSALLAGESPDTGVPDEDAQKRKKRRKGRSL